MRVKAAKDSFILGEVDNVMQVHRQTAVVGGQQVASLTIGYLLSEITHVTG